jgi:Fe-S cluster biogenesis protein NfuA
MFIQTESTSNPDTLRFLPGLPVAADGSFSFPDALAARRSPLAERLFRLNGVAGVFLDRDAIAVTKAGAADWHRLKPGVMGAILAHFESGAALLRPEAQADESDAMRELRDLLDARIRPAMREEGGDVELASFADDTATLRIVGGPFRLPRFVLEVRIENTFRALMPTVEVAFEKAPQAPAAGPGLATPEGQAVLALLESQINPAIAAHGGHVSLVEVDRGTAYLRFEGGCQGCGMSAVTLKHGIENAILQAVPAIGRIVDVTDHAAGENPYFQPAD